MLTKSNHSQAIRLTNQHFSIIRFIFFQLSAAYSLAKIETLINNQFKISPFLQQLENIRTIYVQKDIPNAKITKYQFEEIIFNLHNIHKTINGVAYVQSKDFKETIEDVSYQLNKILSDFEIL